MNTYTPQVAATSFFIHRAEILISSQDEIKRCIAAKRENCLGIFWEGCIANIGVEIVLGFWVRNFIGIALLVIIHIPRTQKWARGFTEPSRYGAIANV